MPDLLKNRGFQRGLILESEWKKILGVIRSNLNALEDFCTKRWEEINSPDRAYGISDNGQDIIEISEGILRGLGLICLQFIQEGHNPPEVGIQIELRSGPSLICRIGKDGHLQTSEQVDQRLSAEIQILLQAVVLSYYSDLVLPASVVQNALYSE